ncbi:hypothetical protein C8034_v012353 [Colletotrichum sidae]|uniref:Uncharacterized protein n=1 Tax=Colletotrichum sidae TaxID=1347389 RepID=A0A4R8TFP3_9PEZI|nr:hypothetical protein C8034_v012353 [Colletotrichum sidae]
MFKDCTPGEPSPGTNTEPRGGGVEFRSTPHGRTQASLWITPEMVNAALIVWGGTRCSGYRHMWPTRWDGRVPSCHGVAASSPRTWILVNWW